jgi:hypothetical protein
MISSDKRRWILVVGALLVAAGVWAFTPALQQAFLNLETSLNKPLMLPRWAVALLGMLAFPTVWWLVVSVIRGVRYRPRLDQYTEDNVFGITWRWEYGEQHLLEDLQGYCPECGMLVMTMRSLVDEGKTVLYCDHCQKNLAVLNGGAAEATAFVNQEIAQRIHTGGWKNKIRQQRRAG